MKVPNETVANPVIKKARGETRCPGSVSSSCVLIYKINLKRITKSVKYTTLLYGIYCLLEKTKREFVVDGYTSYDRVLFICRI